MNMLTCDIQLGGSTTQFLEWQKRNVTKQEFIACIKNAITYRAKTLPYKQARRAACLIGVTYDQLGGDTYILDCICAAISSLNKG